MLSAVILVLREVLEAALIISLLLALTRKLKLSSHWSLMALITGLLGSWWVATNAYTIADAFEGAGQELLNSALFIAVIIGIVSINILAMPFIFTPAATVKLKPDSTFVSLTRSQSKLIYVLFIVIVSCAMTREGSEIWIYLSSFISSTDGLYSVGLGGAIGAGIGLSLGAIAYYLFVMLPSKSFLPVFILTVTLIAGGLSMQVAKELMQIGWLDSPQPLWDSSWLIGEHTLTGELLYALVGYEAKPTPTQVIFYLTAIAPVLIAFIWQCLPVRRKYHE